MVGGIVMENIYRQRWHLQRHSLNMAFAWPSLSSSVIRIFPKYKYKITTNTNILTNVKYLWAAEEPLLHHSLDTVIAPLPSLSLLDIGANTYLQKVFVKNKYTNSQTPTQIHIQISIGSSRTQ